MKHIFLLLFVSILITPLQSQETVTFQFTNATIIGTPPNSQLKFDVELKATAVGTYHSNGQVYFNYNTTAFGSSIFSNGKITIQRLSLLAGTVDVFGTPTNLYDLIQNDNSVNIFALTWNSAFTGVAPNTGALNEVLTSYLPLMQITIDIADPSELAGIDFVQNLMNEQQFFRQSANNDIQYAIPNNYENNLNNQILPIELLSFNASSDKKKIDLDWSSNRESNFYGYELQRSKTGENFHKIAFVEGQNKPMVQNYSYQDADIDFNQIYFYRLKMIDLDGSFEYSTVRNASIKSAVNTINLYPNPLSDTRLLTIQSSFSQDLKLDVYNSSGKHVWTGLVSDGNGIIDLKDLPSGAYVYRIRSENFMKNGMVILE